MTYIFSKIFCVSIMPVFGHVFAISSVKAIKICLTNC